MLNNILKTVKHTAIFAFGNISSKLIGFVLLPIYTKEITIADYGVLGLLEAIDIVLVHILSFTLPHALLRWYSLSESEIEKKSYVFTIFIFFLVVCSSASLLVFPNVSLLSSILFNDTKYQFLLTLLILSISFSVLNKLPMTLLRIEEKSIFFSIVVVMQFTISLLLNIYFVAFKKLGLEGVLYAQTISVFIIFLSLLFYLIRKMHPKLAKTELKQMLVFCYPLTLGGIASTVLSLGDRYLLNILSTSEELGLYTLGYKISNVIKIFFIDPLFLGLPVVAWQLVKKDINPARFFSKTLTYSVFTLVWVGLTLSAYSKGIIHRFALSETYWDAYQVVPFLVIGLILLAILKLFFFVLQIPKKTIYIPLIVSVAAIFNIILNILMIPQFDMLGAAYATILANLVATAIAYHFAQSNYLISYEIRRIFLLFIVGIGVYLITMIFDDYSIIERIVYKGLLILCFPLFLFVSRFYDNAELEFIKRVILKALFVNGKK